MAESIEYLSVTCQWGQRKGHDQEGKMNHSLIPQIQSSHWVLYEKQRKEDAVLALSDLLGFGEMSREGMSTLGKYKGMETCRLTYLSFLLEVREALR